MFLALSLVPVLAFGILSSRSDFSSGLVRNRLVLLFSAIGLLFNLAYGFGDSHYLQIYLSNAAFTFLVGFSLWWAGFWNAADAKLLSAYSLLLPLGVYQVGYSAFFPSQVLLINTFVSVFFVMFFRIFTNVSFGDFRHVLSKITRPNLVLNLALVIFGFSWAFGIALSALGLPSSYFFSIIFIFLVFDLLERFTSLKATALSGLMALLRILLDFPSVFSPSFLPGFVSLVLLFWFFRYLVLYLGFYANSTPVSVDDLAPAMVPVQMPNAIPKEGKYGKHDLFYSDILTLFSEKKVFPIFRQAMPFGDMAALKHVPDEHRLYAFHSPRSGLSDKDVSFLKGLKQKGALDFDSLRISASTPFAHILFAGVLLTYLAKGDLFVFLFTLLAS